MRRSSRPSRAAGVIAAVIISVFMEGGGTGSCSVMVPGPASTFGQQLADAGGSSGS